MQVKPYIDWATAIRKAGEILLNCGKVQATEKWQGTEPPQPFLEVLDVIIKAPVYNKYAMEYLCKPNLPWADIHFEERVGGLPLNPPPSHELWPFNPGSTKFKTHPDYKFDHTYPERFWPKHAGDQLGLKGIRFDYGDLDDVIMLLVNEPNTRQAYLPIFFPEDTGGGKRVPCTIGYHFILREGYLHCTYSIRSCDYFRHFRDDIYLAARLVQKVAYDLNIKALRTSNIKPGYLTMHIFNLHIFETEKIRLAKEVNGF